MHTSDQILKLVNDTLDNLAYDRKPSSLYEPIRYVLSLGGKRIRPVLMLLAYNLFKDDPESIVMPACGLETYHNYTLLHDDLMDNADLRRGHETVHRRWDANTAILSGDSMLVLAYQRIAQCEKEKLAEVLALFTETALEIGEGQQYDMDFERLQTVPMKDYMNMIGLKTSVLIACAAKMGAIIAGAPEKDLDCLYDYGYNLGLAFQVADDYLDAYGDVKVFGKPIGGDILNEKKSWLTVRAFEKADEKVKAELLEAMSMKAETDGEKASKIGRVKDIYNTLEVGEDARKAIVELTEKALGCVSNICDGERLGILKDFADRLVGRTK